MLLLQDSELEFDAATRLELAVAERLLLAHQGKPIADIQVGYHFAAGWMTL